MAGHTCKVVLIGASAPGLEDLRASVAGRLAAAPALTRRLAGPTERPVWIEDERFDIAEHVVAVELDPCDDDAVRGEVARLFAERLDRSRPLWRIDLVPRAGGGAAVVWRIHHALADGTTAMRLADAVLWDSAPARGRRIRPPARPARPGRRPARPPGRLRPARAVAGARALAVRRRDRRGARGGVRPRAAARAPRRGPPPGGGDRQRRRARHRGGGAAHMDREPPRTPRPRAGQGAGEPPSPGRRRGQPRLLLHAASCRSASPMLSPAWRPFAPPPPRARPTTTPRRSTC